MVDFFIHRPVFATVCALLIILAGAVCIPTLPISLYPQLAPPQVTVSSNYVGANSRVVESAVTIPLEKSVNGVEGMRYISSSSSNDGTSQITTTFRTGYDLNIAAVDVQNRVASAEGLLPQSVKNTGVTITKANSNFVFGAAFVSDPPGRYSDLFISNYIDVYVKDALKRVPGVGDVLIFGERRYAMRIWLDPDRLAARSLTASDVVNALAEQNVEIPAGQIGQPPSDPHQRYQITVNVVGRLSDPVQFDNIVLKSTTAGIVQVKDVGHAALGAETYATDLRYNGQDAIGVGLQQLSNANALQVDSDAKAALDKLSLTFPPGLKYIIPFDTTTVVGDSIREVVTTLGEAIIIVIVVIFLFLLDWRATIIPAITIPVSLIGTFAFIKIFGFSINSLTMFGITLATGLVVDDAIVVIENVQRHIATEHCDARKATSEAMGEVTSAVIATSLVLISVFVPVSFFPGTTGILYRQFAMTIAFSIAISAFNALTLSPALAALVLRPETDKRGVFGFIDRTIHQTTQVYGRFAHQVVRLRWAILVLFFAGLGATVFMYQRVPTAFVPGEDQNYLICIVQTPPGASLTYTSEVAQRATALIRQDPDVYGTFAVMGFSFSGSASNFGLIFVPLKAQDERKKQGPGHTASDIQRSLAPKLFGVPGGLVILQEPPAIQGLGSFGGFAFQLQDLGRNTLSDLDRVAHQIIGASQQSKEVTNLYTSYTSNDPQLLVSIDREKAKQMNVGLDQISSTLGVFMGSQYVNDFDFNNRSYRVYVQADQNSRMLPSDLRKFYVRSGTGQMIPLDNLVTIDQSSGPQVITHYNMFRSAEIDGLPAPGVSSGQALAAMEQLAKKNMIQGMSYEWTGLSLEEIESAGKAILIFGLGIIVVYLTLSAQYESFVLPFIIMLSVPMAVLGALSFVSLRGLANDVYCQIGLVMLIGLAAKNAILIVEFAEQIRARGKSIIESAIEAAELRLRPILMTSFAFILGTLPLVFATGAGAMGRRSVGTTIVGGMLVSTILNLVFIPVLYVIVKSMLERFGPQPKVPGEGCEEEVPELTAASHGAR
ncbi:MAG TPA: multidrug efflux RND transporter permease subunit [Terracidiphilus sp.]|nr:multidrug efflux RND transporter permease subunit [Terracidiphilus sp.]